MAYRKSYEWVVECYDENHDIADCSYWDEGDFEKAKAHYRHEWSNGVWANVDFGLCQHSYWEASCGAIDDECRQYFYIDECAFLPSDEQNELPPKRFNKYDLQEVSR